MKKVYLYKGELVTDSDAKILIANINEKCFTELSFINSGYYSAMMSRTDADKLVQSGVINRYYIQKSYNPNSALEFVVTLYKTVVQDAIKALKTI